MPAAGGGEARALTVLTPAVRSVRPFPKRAAIVLAVAVLLAIPHPERWQTTDAILKLVALGSATWLSIWLEERSYASFVGRSRVLRVVVALAVPLGFLALIPLAMVPGVPLAAIGDDATTLIALTLALLWATSASVGSLMVVLIDVVVSAAVQSFRARIQLAVLLLVALAAVSAAGFMLLALSIPEVGRQLGDLLKVRVAGRGEIPAAELDRILADPSVNRVVSLVLLSSVTLLALPAVLSACGKLADAVMERLHPLSRAFDIVGSGQLDVRVEEGGSRDFRQLGSAFNSMVERLGLAQRMERAFGQYVSGQVLERIREQHGEATLPAELREASVFFADVRGFTAMSEKLAPALVLDVLNRYFERVVRVIDSAEGYLDKFIGDAVVVVFNGPIDQPDHAERAARCAIAVQEEVARLNRDNAFPEIGELRVGIGVSTGPLVAGNLGSAEHMEYTVIGDTVNLAARLTGQAGPGEVWVNERNAALLPDDLPRQALPPFSVKGKAQPVVAFRVWPPPGQTVPPPSGEAKAGVSFPPPSG